MKYQYEDEKFAAEVSSLYGWAVLVLALMVVLL